MSIDKYVAERRRFARLLGTADSPGSGLPVGPSAPAHGAGEPAADGGEREDTPADGTAPHGPGDSTSEPGPQEAPHREPTQADDRRDRADDAVENERDDGN